MPNYSLIFARTLQDADDSAVIDWKWDRHDELHSAYRRPDNGEIARFVPDQPGCIQGLRWNTKVYLGRDWNKRNDAGHVDLLISEGFFVKQDPELPPPRRRAKKDETLSEVRRMLARLEK